MVINAIVVMVTYKGYVMSVFFPLIVFLFAFKCRITFTNIIDCFFLLISVSMVFSWIGNTYNNRLLLVFMCIMADGAYMASYFIGKQFGEKIIYALFEKAKVPMAICCVIGIYCFFSPPGWYTSRLSFDYQSEGDLYLEFLRLRSIFVSPYALAYMGFLMATYLLFKILNS